MFKELVIKTESSVSVPEISFFFCSEQNLMFLSRCYKPFCYIISRETFQKSFTMFPATITPHVYVLFRALVFWSDVSSFRRRDIVSAPLSVYKSLAGNTQPSWGGSYSSQSYASLCRAFGSKPGMDDIVGTGLGTTNTSKSIGEEKEHSKATENAIGAPLRASTKTHAVYNLCGPKDDRGGTDFFKTPKFSPSISSPPCLPASDELYVIDFQQSFGALLDRSLLRRLSSLPENGYDLPHLPGFLPSSFPCTASTSCHHLGYCISRALPYYQEYSLPLDTLKDNFHKALVLKNDWFKLLKSPVRFSLR